MNILDTLRNLADPRPELNHLFGTKSKPKQRPAPQMTMGIGALGRGPALYAPGDMNLSPHSNDSPVLNGIDRWNGAPYRIRKPVQMPQVLPRTGGSIWGWWGEDAPKYGAKILPIDPGIRANPRRLPLYLEKT